MSRSDDWEDLFDRLTHAELNLEQLADATNDPEEARRLVAKASGVSLALEYMRGYPREGTSEDFCIMHESFRLRPDVEICQNHLHTDDACVYAPRCQHSNLRAFAPYNGDATCDDCGLFFTGDMTGKY
jgi:hypothetical protein